MIRGPIRIKFTAHLRNRLRAALAEDLGRGDITSSVSVPPDLKGRAVILAKETGIVAGLPVVSEIFRLVDRNLKIVQKVRDGRRVQRNMVVAAISGKLRPILAGERLALNFLQRLSGVATLTRFFTRRVLGTRAKIFDTRKTTPLWRDLEKYAVRVGGGFNHRFSLSETIMVKGTHWDILSRRCEESAVGGASCPADSGARRSGYASPLLRRLAMTNRRLPLIVEVHSRKQLNQALRAAPYVIMFDNHSLGELRRGVRYVREWARRNKCRPPQIEASGGIHAENIRRIAKTGVDRISIGAVTHSAPALDFSLKVISGKSKGKTKKEKEYQRNERKHKKF